MPTPSIGRETFPWAWYKLCQLWIIVAVGSLVMVMVVWIMIFIENTHCFQTTMHHYMGNTEARYGGDINSGYVDLTNIPKHLGGVVFTAIFDLAMLMFCAIALASEVYWKYAMGRQVLQMYYSDGLYDDAKFEKLKYLFLIANAFLKLFIVAATGSESWYGLNPNEASLRTDTFCLYATFILLGSIPFTIIAQMFNIMELRRGPFNEAQKAMKKDLEAQKAAAAEYKKERDALKKAAEKAAEKAAKKATKENKVGS
ncbi:hypothetical protein Q5752_006346 [Cryptotrichosporon argae]